MGQNLISPDRDQPFLLAPDIREWVAEDHPVRFMIDAVEQLDLGAFYRRRRDDGWGRAAYDPAMMVTLLFYAYSNGVRSSRVIERETQENLAYRLITGNHHPDHATIARFRQSHEKELAGLFPQVLGLCAKAGLVASRVVAIDGTKMEANASPNRNVTEEQLEQLAKRWLEDARRIDEEEDRIHGDRRGDELPDELIDAEARTRWIREQLAKVKQTREETSKRHAKRTSPPKVNLTDPDSRSHKVHNRHVQGYNSQVVANDNQIILAVEVSQRHADSPLFGTMLEQAQRNLQDAGVTDGFDVVVADAGYLSRDNVLLDASFEIVIAPGKTQDLEEKVAAAPPPRPEPTPDDYKRYEEYVEAETERRLVVIEKLSRREITSREAADILGFKSIHNFYELRRRYERFGPEALRPRLRPNPPRPPSAKDLMLEKFKSQRVRDLYKQRSVVVEPLFGQIKEAMGIRRFMRRGLSAVASEWSLIAMVSNLRKMRVMATTTSLGRPAPA